jgi:hypothetical protein
VGNRENIDAQAASTDGRATLYANDQAHMFGRKVVIKKQRGGFKYKKTKPSIFSFSYLKRYSNMYTFLQKPRRQRPPSERVFAVIEG